MGRGWTIAPRRLAWLVLGLGCAPDATAVGSPVETTMGSTTQGEDGSGTSSTPDGSGTSADGSGTDDGTEDTSDTSGPAGEWADGWGFRKRVRIHPVADLSDFPVAIVLDDDQDLLEQALDDGSDLMVTDAGGLDPIPYELEWYRDGSLALWVDAGPLPGQQDTVVYLYYGNPSPPAPPPGADVWPERFEGVWHMRVEGTSVPDSVGDPHPAMASDPSTSAEPALGIAGPGADFDGNNDIHSAGDPMDGSLDGSMDSFTVSLWARVESVAGSYDTPLYKGAAQDGDPGYGLFFGDTNPNWVGCVADNGARQHLAYGPIEALLDGWHHFVLTVNRDQQTVAAFLDGVSVAETPLTVGSLDSSDPLTFSNPTTPFRGVLDEIRVQRAAVDAAWAAAEWTNLADRDAFFTVDPPETSP